MRAFDVDEDEIAVFMDFEHVDHHLRRFLVGVVVRERLEVVEADEPRGRLADAIDVEVVLHPPDERLGERGPAPRDVVDVAARRRAVARVKRVAHLVGAKDVDVRGQRIVDPPAQGLRRHRHVDVEVRGLRGGMHAGIRASRSVELEIAYAGRFAHGALDFALHGARVLLNLPAAVPRAGIFDRQLQSHGLGILDFGIWVLGFPNRHYLCTAGADCRARIQRMSGIARRYAAGAEPQPDGSTHFRVWAPQPRQVKLRIEASGGAHDVALEKEAEGYYSVLAESAGPGTRYRYVLDGDALADPASRYQPEGPFGPSEVIDPERFHWEHSLARGVELAGQVFCELHPGTFTPEGTWRSAIAKLPLLADSGITTIELMPISQFPGRFGWGYDGVFPYAPTHQYGTPDDFRSFVDHAHAAGVGVILDVVCNHLGPDGCVFSRFAKAYYSSVHWNEWGDSLNFDGPDAQPVRDYFASNAAYWIDEFRLDGLRLDAVQTIHDRSRRHIIAEIGCRARSAARGRPIVLVAESETQTVRLLNAARAGGDGLDALWNDDFHHSAIVAITGKREADFSDHHGTPQELISAAKRGYLFQGQRYAWQMQRRGTRTDR